MADPNDAPINKALWDALAQAPSTFADLWPIANAAGGSAATNRATYGYDFTDRWLQRGRKHGWMHFARMGRRIVWSLTDAGRAQLEVERGG